VLLEECLEGKILMEISRTGRITGVPLYNGKFLKNGRKAPQNQNKLFRCKINSFGK
jgi:hypothetical protein